MATTRTLAVLISAGALAAAGAVGYLASEARHAGGTATTVAAVPGMTATTLEARASTVAPQSPSQVETAEIPEVATVSEVPVAAPAMSEPARPTPVNRGRAPRATEIPVPAVELPSEPQTPAPVTPALPVSKVPTELPAVEFSPLPALAPPIERVALVIERDSVIGIRMEEPVSSAAAKVEDRVSAIVARDVVVDGWTAIPSGSRIEGHVAIVEAGGKFREKARIGLRFTTLVLPSHERVPILTETIFRDGESPTADATSKIGASAVIGSVLGAIIGGKKGAAIGGAAGAAGGTAVVAKGKTNDAVLAAGAPLTLRLVEPLTIVVEREPGG